MAADTKEVGQLWRLELAMELLRAADAEAEEQASQQVRRLLRSGLSSSLTGWRQRSAVWATCGLFRCPLDSCCPMRQRRQVGRSGPQGGLGCQAVAAVVYGLRRDVRRRSRLRHRGPRGLVFGTELGADFEVASSNPGGVRSEQGRLKPLDTED